MTPPDESDDCLGRYVGFGLADRQLDIRLTGLRESTKPLTLERVDLCNGLYRMENFTMRLMRGGYAGLSPV